MSYNQRQQGDFTVIELSGDVDLARSPDARQQILEVIDNGQHLLIDMSGVSYIDSSGIASLVEGYQTARKRSLKFGLVAVSSSAMSVLSLARLDKVFPIHDSVDARLAADE